ncbi:MAG TPA: trypsin-like peptidase domain-containing protein [Ktedonobacterales bacterium]|nr:trypsin-like peptidase domain-containing protein [Ktedonobacterales bacterium]
MSNFTARAVRRRARGVLSLCVSLCVALTFVWALASADVARAAPVQRASSAAQQAVQLDSPAVVRIVSVVNASVTCSGCAADGSDIHSPSDGGTFTYYSSGSGAFISPTGAILTADHVIDHSMANPDDTQFVEQQAAQDIATQYNVTSDQALHYLTSHPSKVRITFNTVFQKAFLSTAYTGNLPDTKHVYAFALAETVASSPVDAQDTAIVRIDTGGISPAPDFPYLTLSERQVNPLDNVTAIAFPADADLALNKSDFTALADVTSSDVNTINSLLSVSVNTGAITKANEVRGDGTLVYEASSIASNGSSGGPVINDNGEVIGFVDAGPSATDRLTFIIPSAVIGKYLTQAGLASVPSGRFMPMWTAAMAQYNGSGTCHWTSASNDLTTLRRQYPTFGGAAPYLAQAQRNAARETCGTGGASTTGMTSDVMAGLALIGGCAVAIIALILGIIFLVVAMTRRKRRKPAPAPVATYAAPYPPAQAPQPPAAYPPVVMRPASGARVCQNGHAVVEADAAFCPICGAPMQPTPPRG